mgnify:CR=1 FL=1
MTDLTLLSAPRISAPLFAAILTRNHSPAAAEAAELALIPDGYGLDRAIALAFFRHESRYGTAGVATHTRGWGNLRPASWQARRAGIYTSPESGQFALYTTWANSLRDWCELLRRFYVPAGLTTVYAVTPRYAPSGDGNDPIRYAADVVATVLRWQVEDQAPRPAGTRWQALRTCNIRRAPHRRAPLAGALQRGAAWYGELVSGGVYQGNDQWVQSADGRYVWSGCLRQVSS